MLEHARISGPERARTQYGSGVNDARHEPSRQHDPSDAPPRTEVDAGSQPTHVEPDEDFDDDGSFEEIMEEDGEDAGERKSWLRPRWTTPTLGAGIVFGALLGAALMTVFTWSWSDPAQPGEVRSESILQNLSSVVGNARAFVVDDDGDLLLRVEATSLPDVADAYNQVWLVDDLNDPSQALPVGVLDTGSAQWHIPSTANLEVLNQVVITQEQFDGDPTPSGQRLWAGEIGAP